MKNVLKMTALVLCCVALVACSQKGPAEAALTAAQTAVDGVKAEAAKYVPDQAKALMASLTAAREAFDKGDYKVALELAQPIPAKAKDVATAAAAKKDELLKTWASLAASVGPTIDAGQGEARRARRDESPEAPEGHATRPRSRPTRPRSPTSRRARAKPSEAWQGRRTTPTPSRRETPSRRRSTP